ncbi:Ig-like domain-containing protein [Myxococcus sp. AM010]|uniref:Ig-like domain-containing protein n=1 Tax=Myxococcus sp. AM010 TaxID=2745138 RepID=UPI0020D1263E|nr:Ig-like domain-containing protein [Myxococcus sp. AM010]
MNIPERSLPPPWMAAVVLLCASACINVPAVEPAQAEVRITAPAGTAYTKGVVEVRLAVTGHTPDRVELLKDGEVLTELAPPYTYTWDTAGEPEGTYRLEARAALGDVAYVSASREVVVDRTPPQVVSRVPEQGDQEVWVQSPIRAEFSEPVKQSSVTTESVHLTVGDVAVAQTVSLSEDGKTVTVVPVTAFTAPSTVALAFSGTVTDLAGNAAVNLGEAWSWVVPEFVPYPLHSVGAEARNRWARPYIKMDSHGRPLVLHWRYDGTTESLFVTRWTGDSWEQLGYNLKTSTSDYSIHTPTLQVSAAGVPFVAWQEDMGAEFNNYIHVAQWTGERWSRLGGEQGILPEQPHAWDFSMRLTKQGHPVIAVDMDLEATEGGQVHIYQWSQEQWQRIGSPLKGESESSTSAPFLALDEHDSPVVAFGHEDGEGKIFAWRWNNNEWERLGTTLNSYNEHNSGKPIALALDSSNQPIISWTGYRPPLYEHEVFIKTWSEGQWTPITPPQKHPDTGNRTVADTHFIPGQGLLVASTESAGNRTSAHLNIHTGDRWTPLWNTRDAFGNTKSTGNDLSMDALPHGDIVLAWTESPSEQQREIVVYRRNQ